MKITNQSSEVGGLRRRETHFIVPSVLQPAYLKWPLNVGAMGVILPLVKYPQDALTVLVMPDIYPRESAVQH